MKTLLNSKNDRAFTASILIISALIISSAVRIAPILLGGGYYISDYWFALSVFRYPFFVFIAHLAIGLLASPFLSDLGVKKLIRSRIWLVLLSTIATGSTIYFMINKYDPQHIQRYELLNSAISSLNSKPAINWNAVPLGKEIESMPNREQRMALLDFLDQTHTGLLKKKSHKIQSPEFKKVFEGGLYGEKSKEENEIIEDIYGRAINYFSSVNWYFLPEDERIRIRDISNKKIELAAEVFKDSWSSSFLTELKRGHLSINLRVACGMVCILDQQTQELLILPGQISKDELHALLSRFEARFYQEMEDMINKNRTDLEHLADENAKIASMSNAERLSFQLGRISQMLISDLNAATAPARDFLEDIQRGWKHGVDG